MKKLGIIAGGGELPRKIIKHCQRTGQKYFVLAFNGQTDPITIINSEHEWVNLGCVGKAISFLKTAGVTDLVMAGPLHRPSWSEIRPDAKGAIWLAKLATHAFGDDSMFRIITKELEKEGFHITGAESILGDELLASSGVMTKTKPKTHSYKDVERGLEVLKALGIVDVGQASVIQQGMVLGVEAVEGTDELIRRCSGLKRPGHGPILVKISKPGQDRRVDLPTIGKTTIELAKESGFEGIAVEAGSVQMIHKEEVIKTADNLGLFIYGFEVSID